MRTSFLSSYWKIEANYNPLILLNISRIMIKQVHNGLMKLGWVLQRTAMTYIWENNEFGVRDKLCKVLKMFKCYKLFNIVRLQNTFLGLNAVKHLEVYFVPLDVEMTGMDGNSVKITRIHISCLSMNYGSYGQFYRLFPGHHCIDQFDRCKLPNVGFFYFGLLNYTLLK